MLDAVARRTDQSISPTSRCWDADAANHGWHSPAGEGLYVSVLLRPQWAARHMPLLPLAAGLAAASAVNAAAGVAIDLRWPNDLLIGPRKVGGILVEAKTEADRVTFAAVGIGINVHQTSFDPGLSTAGNIFGA